MQSTSPLTYMALMAAMGEEDKMAKMGGRAEAVGRADGMVSPATAAPEMEVLAALAAQLVTVALEEMPEMVEMSSSEAAQTRFTFSNTQR